GFFISEAGYVTIYGLTIRFAGGHGVQVLGDHDTVEKSRLIFNGKGGASFFSYGTIATTDAQLLKSEIGWNVMRNWPRGRIKWGGWPGAAGGQLTPKFLAQGNVSHHNGGEGLATYGGPGGAVFRDNIVYDNWSVNIYLDNQPDGTIENNLIMCHTPNRDDLYNNGDDNPADGSNLRRLRPEGIMTADENYDFTPPANLQNVLIANNVILNCRCGLQHYGQASGSGLRNVRVLNNTIVVPAEVLPEENATALTGISIP